MIEFRKWKSIGEMLGERQNIVIVCAGVAHSTEFSAMAADLIFDLHFQDHSQGFPRWSYENEDDANLTAPPQMSFDFGDADLGERNGDCLCGNSSETCGNEVDVPPPPGPFQHLQKSRRLVRHDNILDETLRAFRIEFQDSSITKDDIFCYVYGILHSPLYKARYQNNLRRELPRIPMAPVFEPWRFAGERLIQLHLEFEECDEYPLIEKRSFRGEPRRVHFELGRRRMRFTDTLKTELEINRWFVLSNIPAEAHDYVTNGKTGLGWLIDRFRISTDKASGILHNPNKWFDETGDNIVSKVKRTVFVSVESAKLIDGLPNPFKDGWEPEFWSARTPI